jgi:lipopolysaccharide transport system permease protein
VERVIEPGASRRHYWRRLIESRHLIRHMAWSDILVRYKQTYLGLGWAIVQPLMSIIIFTLVFDRLARVPTIGKAPYPLMVFAGLLPWGFFAQSLTACATSLTAERELITGVQFPRLVLPLKSLAVAAHNMLVSFVILLVGLVAYGYLPDERIVFFPLFVLFAGITALAIGLWIAVLNVRYRDFAYLLPWLLQLGMYISPVGFATIIVPMKWRFLYSLNPMVSVIDGARWSLFRGAGNVHLEAMVLSFTVVILLLWGGLYFFRRAEGTLADHI